MPPAKSVARPITVREIAAAGRSLAEGSLLLQKGEHVVVVADADGASVGRAVAAAAIALGAQATFVRLETLGPRPHADLHPSIRQALGSAQASMLIASFDRGEFEMRSEFVGVATRHNLRHAHLVGVSEQSVVMGFAVDPRRIELLAESLRSKIGPQSGIHVRSAAGTDLRVRCSPKRRWIEHTGVIRPGMKENLPAGVLETCPGEVDGVFVADGTLGDGNGDLHAVLADRPMRLHISGGVVSRFECDDGKLLADVNGLTQSSAYLDRVGLVGFGLNKGITSPTDDIFTDQKMPGFHLSLGMTFPPLTGATWSATNWIAFIGLGADVTIDGVEVLRAGSWVIA